MIEVGLALLSIILMIVAMVSRPNHGRCPPSMYVSSVARDGAYTCQRTPLDDLDDNHGGVSPRGEFHSRIYCTNGTLPIIDYNGHTVGCQRGGYQAE